MAKDGSASTGSTVAPLKAIHDWVETYERSWAERFDALDVVAVSLR